MTTPPAPLQPWQLETDDGNALDASLWNIRDRERALEAERRKVPARMQAEISGLRDALAISNGQIECLQQRIAEMQADADAESYHTQKLWCDKIQAMQALTLIANMPVADDAYRAMEQLARCKQMARAVAFPPKPAPAELTVAEAH